MKPKIILLLMLANLPFAYAQTPWRLEAFGEYLGITSGTRLGSRVKGFVGSRSNNPYNVAVAEGYNTLIGAPRLLFYHISTPQDTTPLWVIPGGADVGHGDFNGDGLTDLAVWKSVNTDHDDTVLVYLGQPTAISTLPSFKLPAEQQRSAFGRRMCVGDLNNDEIDDLVISAPTYYKDFFGQEYGKIYVYYGRPALEVVPDFAITGDHPGAGLGSRCAIGDFNDDGFNDLVIRGFDQARIEGAPSFGYLKIYFGSAQFDTVADLTSYRTGAGAFTSGGLASFDANGDEKIDLLWTFVDTISTKRSVFIHYGGNDFQHRFRNEPDFIIPAPVGSCDFGNDICNAGDMNGDSDEDLLIAANCTGQGNGIVFVYSGGKALNDLFDAARGQSLNGYFGSSINNVGDINHDGYSDIAIGAPRQPFLRDQGYFGIFLGDLRIPTSVEVKGSASPYGFALHPNYPNPFYQHTSFEFSLPHPALIEIKIYDILGKEVKTLLNIEYAAGQYKVHWNGKDEMGNAVPNGVYFARMKAIASTEAGAAFEQTQKFTVVK